MKREQLPGLAAQAPETTISHPLFSCFPFAHDKQYFV